MIRQNKHSIKSKMIVLIVIYVALIAFSLVWYNTLTGMNCNIAKTLTSNPVNAGSSEDKTQNCSEQLNFHWIKFYGINGIIYGASLLVFVVNVRKSNKN
ncbi:MAG: hypothetical protein ACREBB_08310 [Nitrosotalea sp.]